MLHEIKNIFHFTIIFLCVLFAYFLLTPKNRKRISNIILAAFLIAKAFPEISGILTHFGELNRLVSASFPHLFYIGSPFRFLYVPLLYIYILSLTKKNFHFKKVYFWHFTPFLFICILLIFKFLSYDADSLKEILKEELLFTDTQEFLFSLAAYVQFLVYAIASLLLLKQYRQEIKDFYSSIEHINLSWLNFVLYGFIGWKSLAIIDYIVWLAVRSSAAIFLYIAAEIVFLVFLSLMFLKGLRQPAIFAGFEENHTRQKYKKTLLPKETKEDYKNKLIEYMEREKPFLDPMVSLTKLAKKISISPHHLSQILNSCFNHNFFDFINSYRIRESQKILSEQNSSNKTVLEILYETGFNSKSVFNIAFKKHTGMTPTQFRNQKN